jgi:ABC-type branched-subunit amino acid transport system ATPase component
MLEVSAVHKRFGGLHALRGVSLKAGGAEILGIIGPNGAGKSTLFTVASGFIPPDSGEVRLYGQRIDGRRPDEIAARGMVRTFQVPREFGDLTVLDNLKVAGSTPRDDSIHSAFFGGRRAQAAERELDARARAMVERLNLKAVIDQPARRLSGGQKKLLELGRALMVKPKVLLIDEPFAGVAPALRQQLVGHLRALKAEGLCVLIIEHDIETIMDLSDRICVMVEGAVLVEGPPAEVQRDRRVLDAYLGTHPA